MRREYRNALLILVTGVLVGVVWPNARFDERALADERSPQLFELIKSQRFELVDAAGRTTAVLWNGKDGKTPQLLFVGPDNVSRVLVVPQSAQVNPTTTTRRAALATSQPGPTPIVGRKYSNAMTDLHVSEIIGQGRYLRLSDGSLWEIDSGERSVASSWGTVEVVVIESTYSGHVFYQIYNSDDEEEVGAVFLGYR